MLTSSPSVPAGTARDIHQLPRSSPSSSDSGSSSSRASKPWRNHLGELARQSQHLHGASSNISARNNYFYRPEKPLPGDAPFPAPARAASHAHMAGDDVKLVRHTGKTLVSSSSCDTWVSHPPLQRCRGECGTNPRDSSRMLSTIFAGAKPELKCPSSSEARAAVTAHRSC